MNKKQKLKELKALQNKIRVLMAWGCNIEDANLKSILIWKDGRNYIVTKVFQTLDETIDNAVGLNVSQFHMN